MKCKICANDANNIVYEVKELMYGMDESFEYFECGNCGCLQIAKLPSDMSTYYGENYYSFGLTPTKNKLKIFLNKIRATYAILNEGFWGELIFQLLPRRNLTCLAPLPINRNSSIVDIGCGAGELLHTIKEVGVKNVLGMDPFNEQEIKYKNGLIIKKQTIFDLNQTQDLIMFHHSFEHMDLQLETLEKSRKLLNPGGTVLIRIPTVSSYAWKHYGINWVQLDAPRHFYLHSIKSIKLLAEQAGMEVYHYYYDAWSFQFWGSEQYKKGIVLTDKKSFTNDKGLSFFSKEDITIFEKQSLQLNKINQGDSISFYLRAL